MFAIPIKGESIETLKEYINLPGEESWILLVSYLLFSLTPKGQAFLRQTQG
jgi:hypothetical protein